MEASQAAKHDERILRYGAIVGILLALVCLFYLEENWRGRHAWNQLKRQLEAGGKRIDWTNYIPAPISPDQNFFGEGKMQRWFTGRGGNDLSSRLDGARNGFITQQTNATISTVTVVMGPKEISTADADIILDYDPELAIVTLGNPGTVLHTNENIPLIVLDQVPLSDAITNLARQDRLQYSLDREVSQSSLMEKPVSQRWQNASARAALGDILKQNKLQFIPDSKTGIGRIVKNVSKSASLEPAAQKRLQELVLKAIAGATNDFNGKGAFTCLGVLLTPQAAKTIKPVRVAVRMNRVAMTNEIAGIFPILDNACFPNLTSEPHADQTGSNFFSIRYFPPLFARAEDYLTWSDGFTPEFDLIRQTLKRPNAQMEGDYRNPIAVPIPNFLCHRLMGQTLTDRAKCHLLLGQPEMALQDLTMVRGLCRVMEGRPGGQPITVVAAMIDAAITSLYAETINDGIRLGAWRETDLTTLQAQLQEISLPPLLAQAFEMSRAGSCTTSETMDPDKLLTVVTSAPGSRSLWDKLKDPHYLLLKVGPRGWVYQNMSQMALLHGKFFDGFDSLRQQVSPEKTDRAFAEISASLNHFSPYNFLANIFIPNFSRAAQSLMRNQCAADETLIACGLERYRLAHGDYPKTLSALSPQGLEKIPVDAVGGQPLKYRLKADGQFVLYSVGWNQTDDGGVPGPKKDGVPDLKQGDWVLAGHGN